MTTSHPVSYSRTQQVQIVLPMYVNSTFRLFGGKLMEWIDVVAAVVARRHSGSHVTTASVENLSFLAPARLDDIVVLDGRVTYVGRTSMEVRVDTYVEQLSSERQLVNTAYLTMVALDMAGKPTQVPALELQTEEEQRAYAEGKARREMRKKGE